MEEPRIADTKPAVLELEPGTYHWCACGRSANQPFCDGSHAGTGFRPLEFTIADTRRTALCLCKHSKNKPYCDGTHKQFREDTQK